MKATGRFLAFVFLFSTATLVAEEDAQKSPRPPQDGESVILFLLDNSASLPPLDPDTQRRDAIEKIYGFLKGQPYRLILFGGRNEIYVDAPQYYRNSGKWTDFYFAFEATREVIAEYPEGTDFKMVLITDGKIDPSPREWQDQHVPKAADLKTVAGERTTQLLQEIGLPLYVILIGEEVDFDLIGSMVVAANGSMAGSDYAQGIADFFDDDGMLLRRFIFRVEEEEGLETIEPIVTRIATPSTPRVEFTLTGSLLLIIAVLIGIGVRSFPGSGDREIVELRTGQPVQIAVDRLRRLSSDMPAWSRKGLSLVESSRTAVAGLTAKERSIELPPTGFSLDGMDDIARSLIELPLPQLGERLEELTKNGTKDEQIYALNLEYGAKDMEEPRAERLLTSVPSERSKFPVLDFLRAKVHLLDNEKLRRKLTGPSVRCKVYGRRAHEFDLRPGSKVQLGRYEFRVDELTKGGRKDFKLGLTYEAVPSPLFLKRIVPGSLQRALRLRRTHERIVR
jgi:hypothetical protein